LTIKGTVDRYSANPVLLTETQTIPALDGLMFGVMGRESPPSPADVIITVDHPPLGPQRTRQESWKTQMQGRHSTFHGYYLGQSDGNPRGRWTITGTRAGLKLFSIEFEVVSPTAADRELMAACLAAQLS
jgi:hypothetical protein